MRIIKQKESLYSTRIRVNNKEEWDIAVNYYKSYGFEFYTEMDWLKRYNYEGYVLIADTRDKSVRIVEANKRWDELDKFKDITNLVIKNK